MNVERCIVPSINDLIKKQVPTVFAFVFLTHLLVCLFGCLPRFRLLARLFLCPLVWLFIYLFTCLVGGSSDRLLDEGGNETNQGRTARTG